MTHPTTNDLALPELATLRAEGLTRSSFLVRTTLAAGAICGAGAVSPFVSRTLAQDGGGDVEILNFALTLEFLEAEFYEQGLREVSGLSRDVRRLATELRDNEQEHVEALTTTIKDLGGQPAEKPTFDFSSAYGSVDAFLKTSNTLEDTGVSAYNGAAPMIESKEVLSAAGTIVQVEARHAALVRLLRDEEPSPNAFDVTSTQDEVLEAVQPFIEG